MKVFLFITSVLCLFVLPCLGQVDTMKMPMAQQKEATVIARKSLDDLAQLAKKVDPKSFGFENEMQLRAAKVGVPISDYFIRLDELREYQRGKPAKEMLHSTGRLIFPLEVNQQAKSMVILTFKQEKWAVESFGGKNQIRMLTEVRKRMASHDGRTIKEHFQVRIPALQLMFIGVERGEKIYLSPLADIPRYGLKKGEKYLAEKVVEKLVGPAREHNGLPT